MDDTEYRVGGKGHIYAAAPNHPTKLLEPKVVKGSKPRDWETRIFGECAAIVTSTGVGTGLARHYACCLPVIDDPSGNHPFGKYPYCKAHWPFMKMKQTPKELVKSLRRFL